MSFPSEFSTRKVPIEIWKHISSYHNNKLISLNKEDMQKAEAVINLSMTCKDLYTTLEEERITAVEDLKYLKRLKNCLNRRFKQSKDDFSINMPELLVEAFRMQGLNKNIANLQVLDLKGRMGGTDYIDFLKPKDMSHPIMQFTDRYNRRGIAMHIRVRWDESEYYNSEGILTLFQRYTDANDTWIAQKNRLLEDAWNQYHDKFEHTGSSIIACNLCVTNFQGYSQKILPRILSGTDPVFELVEPSNSNNSSIIVKSTEQKK